MPRRASSGTKGLGKHHVPRCSRPSRGEKCGCSWRGKYKGQRSLLHLWCNQPIDPHDKAAAEKVFTRFKKAIDDHQYDPAGERVVSEGGTTLTEFLDDWWRDHVEARELNQSGLKAEKNVLQQSALGKRALVDLERDSKGILHWLNQSYKQRDWSKKTYGEYRNLLNRIFKLALALKKITSNPMGAIPPMAGVDNQRGELRHLRLTREGIERKLLAACPLLNRTQGSPNKQTKLTQDKADAIRVEVERGALQKDVAQTFQVSPAIVSAIVARTIWNPAQRVTTTKGDEMARRVKFSFDTGVRFGELQKIQLKHVLWNEPIPYEDAQGPFFGYRLRLPPSVTKGGKTTGKDEIVTVATRRSAEMLEARRDQFANTTLKYNAYIFGDDRTGFPIKSFRKSVNALFTLAGLAWGREVGLVWHTIRHEYASRAVEAAARKGRSLAEVQDLTRIKDVKTQQRYVHTRDDAAAELAAAL